MIHIAETFQGGAGMFGWHCRCGAREARFLGRREAREAGERHLAQENRGCNPNCSPRCEGDHAPIKGATR